MTSVFRRFGGPGFTLLVALGFQLSGLENMWVAIGLWASAGIWGLVALLSWEPVKRAGTRTGIRMKGGKGTFESTKIRGQDVAIDTNDTELDLKDTDIK